MVTTDDQDLIISCNNNIISFVQAARRATDRFVIFFQTIKN